MTMNFEQLLDEAEKPAPDPIEWAPPITMTMPLYALYERTWRPSVMREVWGALKEADNALKDYIPDLEARGASLNYGRSVLRKLDRALALLDGQTEKGGAE